MKKVKGQLVRNYLKSRSVQPRNAIAEQNCNTQKGMPQHVAFAVLKHTQ